MKKQPVGMGIVGAGVVGIGMLEHLRVPDVNDRVRVAAICDPVPGRAAAAAGKYGEISAYESYEDLLKDPHVDAVTLCTPIGLHYQQGLAAIEAGKHVHFNKTMTTTVDEATALIERAKDKGVKLVVSPGMMLRDYNRRIRKAILEGRLGKLTWAITGGAGIGDKHVKTRSSNDVLSDVDPSWYYKSPGGGPQYDYTAYSLHSLTGILGPVKRVSAMSGMVIPEREFRGKKIVCDMDDSTFLLLDFGDSLFAVVYAAVSGRIMEGFFPVGIYGTAGAVVGTRLGEEDLKVPGEQLPHVIGVHVKMNDSHVFEDIMQLVDWIYEGKPTLATAEHARHVIDIIESGYRAARTGEAQDLRTTFAPLSLNELAV
jgi:predicted dehydrogenase